MTVRGSTCDIETAGGRSDAVLCPPDGLDGGGRVLAPRRQFVMVVRQVKLVAPGSKELLTITEIIIKLHVKMTFSLGVHMSALDSCMISFRASLKFVPSKIH